MTARSASINQVDMRVANDESISNAAHVPAPDVARRFPNDGKLDQKHLRKEIHPDSDLTWSVIARGNLYVMDNYPLRSADLIRIPLGFFLMSVTREITARAILRISPTWRRGGPNISGPTPAKRASMKMAPSDFPTELCQNQRSRDARNNPSM